MTDLPFHRRLNNLVRTEVKVFGTQQPVFRLCGMVGFLSAMTLAWVLAARCGLSLSTVSLLTLASALTFLSLAMLSKIANGQENLTYYRHEATVLAVAAVLLWRLGRPLLPYLDLVVLGLGTFLAFGRIGCFMVGCCHGRPHEIGVRYGQEHGAEGFPSYLVGVCLFPLQLIESLLALIVVGVGTGMVLEGRGPGEAVAWYIIAYGAGRFLLEFARGDPHRPYAAGFSEAQWTSLGRMVLAVAAEAAGILPFSAWHAVATAAMSFVLIGIAVKRRYLDSVDFHLLLPVHMEEIGNALDLVSRLRDGTTGTGFVAVPIATTSCGVQISAGLLEASLPVRSHGEPDAAGSQLPGCDVYCYALSERDRQMTRQVAQRLGELVVQLRHPAAPNQLVQGGREGIYHLLVARTVAGR